MLQETVEGVAAAALRRCDEAHIACFRVDVADRTWFLHEGSTYMAIMMAPWRIHVYDGEFQQVAVIDKTEDPTFAALAATGDIPF